MLTKKVFAKEIYKEIWPLKQTDNWHNAFSILGNYCLIALAIGMTSLSSFAYPVAVLVIGSRLRALENLTHEASHNTLFRSHFLNDWIGSFLCAYPVHLSIWIYRAIHPTHHKHACEAEDPDLKNYNYFPLSETQLRRLLIGLFTLTGSAIATNYLKNTFRLFLNAEYISPHERTGRWLYWLGVLGEVTYFGWWQPFILFYFIPFFTSYRVIRSLAEMSEHLVQEQMEIKQTRNSFCHPITRFLLFPHSDYLHLVHHLFPSIPGYNLESVHQLLLADEDYRQHAHHCYGYFIPTRKGAPTVLQSMMKVPDLGSRH